MSATLPEAFGAKSASSTRWPVGLTSLRSLSTRRRLQVALGFIWLVDAALQYQPYMFGRAFVTQTIEPAAAGTPYVVEHPALWSAHLMIHHITFYNSLFASIQLLIALGLFFRPTVKAALAVSMAWSLAIWWLAEGIGGITVGASAIVGAPGATIIYAFIAVLVWPRTTDAETSGGYRSVALTGPLGALIPRLVWALLWLGLAALGLEDVNRAPSALHDTVTSLSAGEPGWIKRMNAALARPLAHHGTEWSIVLAALFAVLALGMFVPRLVRPVIALAIVVGLWIWLVEDFGGIATGSATDVNSGPLLVLLAACYWPTSNPPGRSSPTGAVRRARRAPAR